MTVRLISCLGLALLTSACLEISPKPEITIPLRFKGYWIAFSRNFESQLGTMLIEENSIRFAEGGLRNCKILEVNDESIFMELDKPIDEASYILLGPISGWDEELQTVKLKVSFFNKSDGLDSTIINGVEYTHHSKGLYIM